MDEVDEGRFSTGVPYLRLGTGPPLLVAAGLTAEHANPTGRWRKMSLAWAAPFAEHFTVYLVNRRPGLAPGTTMSDIAADYAGAIENDLGGPALVHGTSSGGSVALQLAIDHPHLVKKLVVAAAACRLSERGRQLQLDVARLTREGEGRKAWALMLGSMSPAPLRYPARGMGWLIGGAFTADDPSDMLAVIEAEDTFDVEARLGAIDAPALVLGGTEDVFYSEDLFQRTADGMPQGKLVLYPGKGHIHVAGSKGPATLGLGFLLGG